MQPATHHYSNPYHLFHKYGPSKHKQVKSNLMLALSLVTSHPIDRCIIHVPRTSIAKLHTGVTCIIAYAQGNQQVDKTTIHQTSIAGTGRRENKSVAGKSNIKEERGITTLFPKK